MIDVLTNEFPKLLLCGFEYFPTTAEQTVDNWWITMRKLLALLRSSLRFCDKQIVSLFHHQHFLARLTTGEYHKDHSLFCLLTLIAYSIYLNNSARKL